MNRIQALLLAALLMMVSGTAIAQSYDDIYYTPKKSTTNTKQQVKTTNTQAASQGFQQPASNSYSQQQYVTGLPTRKTQTTDYMGSDNFSVNGTRDDVSVDEYNRRGIFADDEVTQDTDDADFQNTRNIERFYDPNVVQRQYDEDLNNLYYSQPQNVNIYVNTPSGYWGYDYFSPSFSWNVTLGNPWYWDSFWRWNSPWYWNTWYAPGWAFTWGPSWGWSWGWGPGWNHGWNHGWHHGWGNGWNSNWGWNNPRHMAWGGSSTGNRQPTSSGRRPGMNVGNINGGSSRHPGASNTHGSTYYPSNGRPSSGTGTVNNGGYNTGRRPGMSGTNSSYQQGSQVGTRRPGSATQSSSQQGVRPGVSSGATTNRQPAHSTQPQTTKPSVPQNNYKQPSNTNGGRSYNSGSSSSSSRGSWGSGSSNSGSRGGWGGSSSGGGRSSGGGGRGRH